VKHFTSLIARYVAHDDPLAAAANLVALAIGLNQPLYPLTLYLATGGDVTWAFIDFVSGPCFLAIPAIMRRHSLGGRVAMVVLASLDTFISVKVFGQASGAEFYLLPCLLLAALLFRKHEVRWSYGLTALIFVALVGMNGRYGVDFLQWSASNYETLVRINAVSVAMLTTFIGVCVGRARGDG
jgi:hypothetical protein